MNLNMNYKKYLITFIAIIMQLMDISSSVKAWAPEPGLMSYSAAMYPTIREEVKVEGVYQTSKEAATAKDCFNQPGYTCGGPIYINAQFADNLDGDWGGWYQYYCYKWLDTNNDNQDDAKVATKWYWHPDFELCDGVVEKANKQADCKAQGLLFDEKSWNDITCTGVCKPCIKECRKYNLGHPRCIEF